jgi:CheY-like chemotaxis protein
MQTIMLAEDDQTMLALLRTLLEIEGFQVKTFGGKTQDELINLLTTEKPDIMLMDVNLYKINGVEALRTLRQMSTLKDLRVIMTSGSDVKDLCVKEGANAFLMKPFMPDTLIKTINGQLTNQ